MERWTRSRYTPALPLYQNRPRVTEGPEHIRISREAAEEGMVLLKNEDQVLPLRKGSRVVLFGKASCDYVKGGEGSGLVNSSYARSLAEGLRMLPESVQVFPDTIAYYEEDLRRQYAAGRIPGLTAEPALPESLVAAARAYTDTAIISLCRTSGEGWDAQSSVGRPGIVEACNQWMADAAAELFPNGCWYLSEGEQQMIEAVCAAFPRVIVNLNTGSIMDCSWIREDARIQAAFLSWQGGQEGGLALARLLTGIVMPSGHLADTIPMDLLDIPSTQDFHQDDYAVDCTEDIYVGYRYYETIPGAAQRVCYPFGYGLSYTTFSFTAPRCRFHVDGEGPGIAITVDVTNTGNYPGREVVQVYLEAPQGRLGKAARVLVGYHKTALLQPQEQEHVEITLLLRDYASYDDTGILYKSAYILEKGSYQFHVGANVRDTVCCEGGVWLGDDWIVKRLTERLRPYRLPRRLHADGTYEELTVTEYPAEDDHGFPRQTFEETEAIVPASRRRERYHLASWPCGNPTLDDVADGRISLQEFVASLPDEFLADMLGGQPNTGVASSQGIGNVPEYGVPNIMSSDGPAGINIQRKACVTTTCFPCCTLLACTWNPEITYAVGAAGSEELLENNLGLWLTPAVNIHRSPLCGRNFEYYSEDPLLAARQAGALIRGVQSHHAGTCLKHYALNGKETERKFSDTRVSERAAREIYLKPFEIIVREVAPWAIMGAYNAVNGIRACENHDLLTGILREEWGYRGLVMTDWWTSGEQYREILAGVDLKMGCGFPERLLEAMERGLITRGDLERAGAHVLELVLRTGEAPLYL